MKRKENERSREVYRVSSLSMTLLTGSKGSDWAVPSCHKRGPNYLEFYQQGRRAAELVEIRRKFRLDVSVPLVFTIGKLWLRLLISSIRYYVCQGFSSGAR